MSYEQFKDLWIWALRESGLLVGGVVPIEESLDLMRVDRRCESNVHLPVSERVVPFHVSASLGFRWDALKVAPTDTTEEDMLHELYGPIARGARARRCRGFAST